MPVPKRKRSRSRRDKRFATWGLKVKAFTKCMQCQHPLPTHQACPECGYYKGVKVIETKAERAVKRGESKKAKEAKKKSSPYKEQQETESK